MDSKYFEESRAICVEICGVWSDLRSKVRSSEWLAAVVPCSTVATVTLDKVLLKFCYFLIVLFKAIHAGQS